MIYNMSNMKPKRNTNTEITFTDQISQKGRRDFIKVMSALFAGAALPLHAVAGIVPDELKVTEVKDHFSLNKILPLVESLMTADVKHKKGASLKAQYSLFSLGYDRCRKEGQADLQWTVQNDKRVCEFLLERDALRTGLKSFYYQKSYHQSDQLKTPLEWNWESKVAADFNSEAFTYTETEGGGSISGRKLKVFRGDKNRSEKLENSPLLKWSHLPVLMELEDDEGFRFDWIDEMEQVFTGHQLRYAGEALISTENGKLPLRAFQHTGTGKIPTVYWLYNNIMLMVISGTEVYVLDDFNGKPFSYNPIEGRINRTAK